MTDRLLPSKLRTIEPFSSPDGIRAEVEFHKLGDSGCVVVTSDTPGFEQEEVVLSAREAHDLMLWLECALGLSERSAPEAAPSIWKRMCDEAPVNDGRMIWWDYGNGGMPVLTKAADFCRTDGGYWAEAVPPTRSVHETTALRMDLQRRGRDTTLEMASLRLLGAIESLGQFTPDKITYFEASPTKDAEAHKRWAELNDAGKLVREILQHRKDSESPVETKPNGLVETMSRVYCRLQCADVPRGSWHEEVSQWLLCGPPPETINFDEELRKRDRAQKASGDEHG